MNKLSVIVSVFCAFVVSQAFAQEQSAVKQWEDPYATGYNKYAVRPIHQSDIMYIKTLVRAIDLREKQNLPMFSKNREITRLLIEGVKSGTITPYANDSLDNGNKLTIDEFNKLMLIPSDQAQLTPEEIEMMRANGEDVDAIMAASSGNSFFPMDLYQLEIKEEWLFDKQRSRQYFDIIAITMFVPSDHPSNIKGIQYPVASFSYKELCDKLFKDNPKAIWFNPENDKEHKNLSDAFDLRLFSSYIIKVSNPKDAYITDIYGGDQKKGIMASQWAAFTLLEYEHNLWEF
ncbi:MAG: gliding motility protein GldN [Cytophagaceae bacterium]|jgi:gliding motility associated protien GldN|nr:gliding motility protein GldN [Cytophagaceae bacterium]